MIKVVSLDMVAVCTNPHDQPRFDLWFNVPIKDEEVIGKIERLGRVNGEPRRGKSNPGG